MKCHVTKRARLAASLMIALSGGTASLFAAAQSTVTIYGVIDSGVEVATNVGPTKDRVVRVPTLTGTLPSRLGFRGVEDLGGGLRAQFVLEQGFAPDTGSLNQGGRAFGRQAWVGVGGNWGLISVGRQYSRIYWELIGDTMGPNIHAAGLLDGYLPNARLDNAIGYTGTFGAWSVGATYSLGRDAVAVPAAGGCAGESTTDRKACRDVSGSLRYTAKDWAIAGSFERMWGGTGAGTPLPTSSQTDTRSIVSGYVNLGDARIGAGLVHRENQGSPTPKSDFWFLGGTYPIGLLQLDAQIGHIDFKNSGNDASVLALRALYSLSKRTAVYVSGGRMFNKGAAVFSIDGGVATGSAPLPGVDQTGLMVGVRHSF